MACFTIAARDTASFKPVKHKLKDDGAIEALEEGSIERMRLIVLDWSRL